MKELAVFWGWQYDFSQQNCEKQFREKFFSTVYFSQLELYIKTRAFFRNQSYEQP